MIRLYLFSLLFISKIVFAEANDTATSTNILPNANVTSSSMDQFDLDGVSTSYGDLTNNSTVNGFTVTCDTLVNNSCGTAFNGELESSHDMTVSASGSLVGITGVDESGNSHTSNQKKLDGGIKLSSTVSVQNCEWSNSQWACGNSQGAVDSFTTTVIIKDSSGSELAKVTQIRTDDAGYYANSKQFTDTVVHNGTGANAYDWSWSALEGSGSTTSSTLGTNLLGAELILEFPTVEYEPFTPEELEEINNQLDNIEIWDVISEMENQIETEIYEFTNTNVSVSLEENFTISLYEPQQQIEESVIEEIISFIEEEKIEEIKEEVTAQIEEKIKTQKEEIKEEEPQEEIKEEVKEEKQVVEKKEETTKEPESNKEEIQEDTQEEKQEEEIEVVTSNDEEKDVKEKIEINITDNVKVNIQEIKLFDNPDSLSEYQQTSLYEPKELYVDNRADIFFQSDLTLYAKDVYVTLSFNNYINIDPLNVRDKKLYDLNATKIQLMLELKSLKN